jgi:hypothetical protein
MARSLRKRPKMGTPIRAPRKVRAPRAHAGAITAPASAARSGTMGVGSNRNLERTGVGPGHKVPPLRKPGGGGPPGGGAPPGAPESPGGPQAIPESALTANERAEAWSKYNLSEADIKHQIYLAALEYGDPDVVAQYGDAVPTPGGALQMAEKEGGESRRANTLGRGQNNTFFSGMNLEDIRRIGDTESLRKKEAKDNWEKALWDLTIALEEAREAREETENNADLSDLAAFEESEPEPMAPGGGGKGKGKKGKGGGGGGKGKGGGKKRKGPNVSRNQSLRKVPRTPLGGGTYGTGGNKKRKR